MPQHKARTTRLLHTTLVAGQIVIAAWIVFTSRWPLADIGPATLVAAGSMLSAWALKSMGLRQLTAMPAPRPGAALIRGGPYRWIRHPMYAGLFLLCSGLLLTHVSPLRACLLIILITILAIKAHVEEVALQTAVPGYKDYCRLTKRFIPFIW